MTVFYNVYKCTVQYKLDWVFTSSVQGTQKIALLESQC